MVWFFAFLGVIGSYLVGSLSSAVLISRALDLPDPRQFGSKNPGATNVLRLGGKKGAIVVLLLDVFKGFLPVFVAKMLGMAPIMTALCAVAVFLGHAYPVFFEFKGGKGVATGIGLMFALSWPAALIMLLIWLAMAFLFRYSSLAAISAAIMAPGLTFLFGHTDAVIPVAFLALLLLWRHRSNMLRLLKGQESKIGASY